MSKTRWNKGQLNAINTPTKNILVSAGAGSGKTSVLSERVLEKLKAGWQINRFLILTFTNAAAAEMKERIRKKIIETEGLENQVAKIDTSYICTFDSFALAIIKKYHYALNLPQTISICDESVMKTTILKQIDIVLDEYYQNPSEEFKKLVKAYVKKKDDSIRILLMNIYLRLTLKVDIEDYLSNIYDYFYNKEEIIKLGNKYVNILINKIRNLQGLFNTIIELANPKKVDQVIEVINNLKNINSYDELLMAYQYYKKLPNKTNAYEGYDTSKSILKEELEKIKDELTYSSFDEMIDSVEKTKDYTKVVIEILLKLHQNLNKYKDEHQMYSFNDIAKKIIELVQKNKDIRNEISQSFDEIMIDEYQDTSDLQECFISYISRNNVYQVGDIKQSIYRFRNANPDLFTHKYNTFSDYDENSNQISQKIDLSENYRTREETLMGINVIFNEIMTLEQGGADYKNRHQLIYGNKTFELKAENQNYNISIIDYQLPEEVVLDKKYKKNEQEAFIIVKDIINKVNNHYQVLDYDKNKKAYLRNCKYSDFAILLRSTTDFETYKKIFEYHHIPLKVYKKESMFGGYDLKIIVNILKAIKLIKNEQKYSKEFKYLFVSIARSYVYRLSDEEILKLISDNSYLNFELYQKLERIALANNVSSNKMLLDMIIKEFNLYNKISEVGNIENLIKELEFLSSFSESHDQTEQDFISSLEEIVRLNVEATEDADAKIKLEYEISLEMENACTLMTIHGSKGLEFNICYFPGLYRNFLKDESNDKIVYNDKIGIITEYDEYGLKKTFIQKYLKHQLQKETISEEIRLFYVALTRAKEKAILLVSIDENKKYIKGQTLSSYQKIMELVMDNPLFEHINVDISTIGLTKKYLSRPEIKTITNEDKKLDKIIINDQYLKKIKQEEKELKEHYSKASHKLFSKEELEKMAFGTEIHYILETLDFNSDNIFKDIDELNVDLFIKNKIKSFFQSDLMKNYKKGKIYHEYEFIDNSKHGIIDLMIEYEDYIDIIDYKLKNIDDEAYINQLSGYKEYIEKISNKKVNIYLYSILDEKYKQI